jgi:hypothetical protein
MGKMALGYGSEFHLLRWLGRHRNLFNKKIQEKTGISDIDWCDFKFNSSKFIPDEELTGLDFCNNEKIINQFKTEWPKTGKSMNWDLVGYSKTTETWVLCEAKAHLGELRSNCDASAESRKLIEDNFLKTKKYYGFDEKADWMKNYYQQANRIYCLGLFHRFSVKAILLNIYFVGDIIQSPKNMKKLPKNKNDWENSIKEMYKALGIDNKPEELKELFLNVSEKKHKIKTLQQAR